MLSNLRYNLRSPSFYVWAFSFFPRTMSFLSGAAHNRGSATDLALFRQERR